MSNQKQVLSPDIQPQELSPQQIRSQIQKIKAAAERIRNKQQKILFLTPDTQGNPRHNVITIYKQAEALREAGYDASIFHEKKDYHSVGSWLGSKYDKIPHFAVEEENTKRRVQVSHSDFLIAPEVFGNFIAETKTLPVNRVMYVHEHEYMLEAFTPSKSWLDYNVTNTIAGSNVVADYIRETLNIEKVYVAPEFIGKQFGPSSKPKKPLVAIYTRNPRKTAKIIKLFYQKYPSFRWINFKHIAQMHNMTLADQLKECMLGVWVDRESSWGSFPLECIRTNIPVAGLLPDMVPEWADDNNGMWTPDENQITDIVANYVSAWLTGKVPEELENVAATIEGQYEEDVELPKVVKMYEELFEEQAKVLDAAVVEGETRLEQMNSKKTIEHA